MNIQINKIIPYLKKIIFELKNFLVPIFILLIVSVNGFLIYKINEFSNQQPSTEQVLQQQKTIKRINLDDDAITKIQKLQERNIAVKALFNETRNNPFKDN